MEDRIEYRKAGEEFIKVAQDFGIFPDPILESDVQLLMRLMGQVDDVLDSQPDLVDRDRIDALFERFMRLAGSAANLGDKLIDAPADYRNHERLLPPNFAFYLKTTLIFSSYVLRLFWMYPEKLKKLRYWIKAPFKYYSRYRAKIHESEESE
ncbi:MAG: hypothetical protein ACD_28C00362G0004 [uncultured bacterium]|nr:MAG: hypothetical protein ACD_28C00362G0004 [uncultured bacterium]KKT76969.1 MAG: hypothetical protein UW70_C0007G0026 [Candidatus Peregrinibacteria bacterium GW2011_GWA2_44_7]